MRPLDDLPPATSPALRERFLRLSADDKARILERIRTRADPVLAAPAAATNPLHTPLSPAQQRLWLLAQIDSDQLAYSSSNAYLFRGSLDRQALDRALSTIVARHAPLRTTFSLVDGEPQQVVHPPGAVALTDVDLSAQVDTEAALHDRRREAERAPFDLATDYPCRFELVRLSATHHALLVTTHHVAFDGWSRRIFWRELVTGYDAFHRGVEPELAPLPVDYASFTAWQRRQLQGPRLERLTRFWAEQLTALPGLQLPLDRPRPPVFSSRGGTVDIAVPAGVAAALRQVARRCEATLHITLLAAFAWTLARLSGQDEFGIGVPTAGRLRPELEPLIGMFVNTLVIRCDLSGDPTFAQVVTRLRRTSLDAYDHQDLPFERVVDVVHPQRHLNRNPLVQVLFQLLDAAPRSVDLDHARIEPLARVSQNVRFDLEMLLRSDDVGIAGRFEFASDLFDRATVEQWAGVFAALLRAVADAPDVPLRGLPLTSATDIANLAAWNRTSTDEPRGMTVPAAFDAQVARTPTAVALASPDGGMTFIELQGRARAWSRRLRALGASPGALVALCLPRSADQVVAVLAILDAGAAYVPIDLGWPAARRQLVLDDSGASLLVTNVATAPVLSRFAGPRVLVDDDELAAQPASDAVASPRGHSTDPAYVLFTSGSTGRPKGVVMAHGPLVNLLTWHQQHVRLGRPARTLQFAPVEFDVSFQDIVATWCTGGTVVVIDDDTRRDPRALLDALVAERIERIYMPFVALQQLAEVHAARPRPLPSLRDVVSAGESLRLTPEIRTLVSSAGGPGGCRLHNHYGPTEAHVVTAHELDADPSTWPEVAPIGRPVANVRIHVLDEARQPLPPEVPGELYIGGASLALGYHNRPDLTAERFVAVEAFAGERMYRSGDRARWRSDGTLEFLGRFDDQVKVRGHRVELGEVEAVAARIGGVAQAAAVVRADRAGTQQLVGYVVPATGAALEPRAVLAELRLHLPEYMVPAIVVTLPALPLLPNGKLDRAALPVPSFEARPEADADPAGGPDAAVAGIWREILGVNRLDPHDSFFELGGHSMMAVRMLAQVEAALGAAPPLRAVFEHPTLREFAAVVRRLAAVTPAGVGMTCVHRASASGTRRAPLVVLPSMFGYAEAWRPLCPALDRTVYAVEFVGAWSLAGNQATSLETIAAATVAQIRRQLPDTNVHVAGYSFGGRLAYEVGQQLGAAGWPPRSVVVIDASPGAATRPWAARDALSVVANAPRWLMNELRVYGPATLLRRARARWRFRRPTTAADIGVLDPDAADALRYARLGQWFELDGLTVPYRRRLLDMLGAFQRYEPTPTEHRVVYMHSRVRPLVHRYRHDGGWPALVRPDRLVCVTLPGDHGSALHPRWQGQVTAALRQALEDGD